MLEAYAFVTLFISGLWLTDRAAAARCARWLLPAGRMWRRWRVMRTRRAGRNGDCADPQQKNHYQLFHTFSPG